MAESPTYKQDKKVYQGAMTFPEAMQAVIEGKKVTRVVWDDSSIYVCLSSDRLRIVDSDDGLLHPLIVCEADMRAADWAEV